MNKTMSNRMIDLTSANKLEIQISDGLDGKPVVWVNVDDVCVLRAQRIEYMSTDDMRLRQSND